MPLAPEKVDLEAEAARIEALVAAGKIPMREGMKRVAELTAQMAQKRGKP